MRAIKQFAALSLAAAFSLSLAGNVQAHEGHDHGDAAPAPSANGPQRQPDGSVFLPKPAQRQIGVRTRPVQPEPLARTHELAGKVVMDPNAGGRVQSMLMGRLVPGPQGLPKIGQAVKRGDVLAYVEPANGVLERSGQQAQIAELQAAQVLARKRLARVQELADTVPRKEIEVAESEVASLAARARALSGGLSGRDVLKAPVSGVIAASPAVAGQVVDARELVFEVVDPTQLYVEALTYDPGLAQNLAGAHIAVNGRNVALEVVGAASSLREQALPLLLKSAGGNQSRLVVGQPVAVYAQESSTVQGYRVPVASLMKNAANQNIVWVKHQAERFEPRVVITAPLDGDSIAVTSGIEPGDRVVIEGAALINQVR
ncbi:MULTISPECIES: efflux RND transporter periplasmic adaptor subunit [Gammaproteobacteria]|uniref:efflux RND transporter periplasmic adaptor subunit n=1 Tax=Gammaproteobacteria TaxID=1236 RepID=UPI001659431C|nr:MULTISPECIES: HlyD family efflux transporter periplasmic adaptor subunit [Gammaproteobacteria]MCD9354729.1 HlyD family efflux transporter periplasmic adaptor subunit [Klebsiella pneumoniae]MCD9415403.1 HlyD family efflux transporter periplasmic adaptor subunit [Klebsiella pneumoniae]MCD9608989.1 HlyD family efflux transporter periplasmic adaptor subunit [Raoultella planticola]MDE9664877.1 HlyD family efflux transporter periplasmic adaptor subunit [Citrobacter portucalensis]MDE9674517.1 HlyD